MGKKVTEIKSENLTKMVKKFSELIENHEKNVEN